MSEKVRIKITASQTFHFDQIVEITKEQWEQIKGISERDMHDGDSSPLVDLIDAANPSSWDDFDNAELCVVDAERNAVKPIDEYCP